MKLQYTMRKQTSHVELHKDQRCCLGISVTDSGKEKHRPVIKSIKHGKLAQRSHNLSVGDVILSIRGHDTLDMSKKEAKRLLKEPGTPLHLEVEYSTREACFSYCRVTCYQRLFLRLRKEDGSFGFVLRKNDFNFSESSEYPIISNIKSRGPADKEGSMMDGDRLLEVDGRSLSWLSLSDASALLQEKDESIFLIEYSVGMPELWKGQEVKIEVDCTNVNLGLTVALDRYSNMCVTSIHQGSLAQRCGLFHVGDEIVAINGAQAKKFTEAKANDVLRRFRYHPGTITYISKGGALLDISDTDDVTKLKGCSYIATEIIPSPFIDVPLIKGDDCRRNQVQENEFFKCTERFDDCNDLQLKTMDIIKDINLSVSNLFTCISEKKIEKGTENILKEPFHYLNFPISYESSLESYNNLSKLKTKSMQIKKISEKLTTHAVKSMAHVEPQRQNKPSKDNSSEFVLDLIESLNEVTLRRFMSSSSLQSSVASISKIDQNCSECKKLCYIALFAVRKVLLLLSLSDTTSDELRVIQQVMNRVNQLPIPCEDCIPWYSTLKNQNSEHTSKDCFINCEKNSNKQNNLLKIEPKIELDMSQETATYKLLDNRDMQDVKDLKFVDYISDDNSLSNENETNSACTASNIVNHNKSENCGAIQKTKQVPNAFLNRNLSSTENIPKPSNRFDEHFHSVKTNFSIPKNDFREASSSNQAIFSSHLNSREGTTDINSTGFGKTFEQKYVLEHNKRFKNATKLRTHSEIRDVLLKVGKKGSYGLVIGYKKSDLHLKDRVPIITAIQPNSSSYKSGLLCKGDRILALNGLSTTGISIRKLKALQQDVFALDQVVLRIEFNVAETEVRWGTFNVELEDSGRLGLVMDESKNCRVVRGILKGSAAHRSGEVFAGDELLSLTKSTEEKLDLQDWRTNHRKTYRLLIKRQQEDTKYSPMPPFEPTTCIPRETDVNVKRTFVEATEGTKQIVLEQEFTLYRDPIKWDFGFMLGENLETGKTYITDIRPGGPAHNSKVIMKKDRIIEVNGCLVDGETVDSVMTLLMQTDYRVHLRTQRVYSHK